MNMLVRRGGGGGGGGGGRGGDASAKWLPPMHRTRLALPIMRVIVGFVAVVGCCVTFLFALCRWG